MTPLKPSIIACSGIAVSFATVVILAQGRHLPERGNALVRLILGCRAEVNTTESTGYADVRGIIRRGSWHELDEILGAGG